MAAERFPDVPISAEEPADYRIRLFDACRVSAGRTEIALKSREQRVVALLALEGARPRSYLAGMLWPETAESRAAGSLRAAVWQIEHTAPGLLVCSGGQLSLNPEVAVDVRDFIERAHRISILTAQPDGPDSPCADECLESLLVLMRGDLLSGWYDDWVLYERARLQQMRLTALEAIAERLTARGQVSAALMAAMAAAAIEPLRESAQRAVIRIHLANGNYNDAIREYRSFGRRLVRELGVRPSAQMDALVRPLLAVQASRTPVGAGYRAVR
ncbi:MAG TPA: BTAD domain-containing putative transcriptional regulator [Jatrophihabitans sp.]|jgi:DNA-binding SARP family transcriptional activator